MLKRKSSKLKVRLLGLVIVRRVRVRSERDIKAQESARPSPRIEYKSKGR
jgi:hypothetical protein